MSLLRLPYVVVGAITVTLVAAGTGRALVHASTPNYALQLVGLDLAFHWSAVPGLAEKPCGMSGRSVISDPNTAAGRSPIAASTARAAHGWHVATSQAMEMSLNWIHSVGQPTAVRFLSGTFAIRKPHAPVISATFQSGLPEPCPVKAPQHAIGQPAATWAIRVPLSNLATYHYVGQVCAFIHVTGGPSTFTETVKFAKALPFYSDKPRTSPCA